MNDELSAAFAAERAAWRAQCEADGQRCPSCGVLSADLPAWHDLAITDGTLRCADGSAVPLAGNLPAAIGTQLADSFALAMATVGAEKIIGLPTTEPREPMTGFLAMLQDERTEP